MRVGILTAGGDCPGLNAVIRAAVRAAEVDGPDQVIGFHDAWRGVLEDRWEPLGVERCRGILPRGGTILGTSRDQPYQRPDGADIVGAAMATLGLNAMIAIGGEGTMGVLDDLHRDGIPVIGVPKTIDNDILATEMTFGFQTAVQICTDAIDRLHTTAESHDRVLVVEVMGRHVGHIAAWAGLAGGATITIIPEEPFDLQEIATRIVERHTRGRWATIVVVAEGAVPKAGTLDLGAPSVDRFGHQVLGGIGHVIAREIERRTGIESRTTVLGHVQRGGSPVAFDRVLGSRFGIAAIDAVRDRAFGAMVALRSGAIVRVPLREVVGHGKTVPEDIRRSVRIFDPQLPL